MSWLDAIGGFFADLADGKMWRSLGWLLLGIVLMVVGVVLWAKKPIEAAAGGVAKAAALAG